MEYIVVGVILGYASFCFLTVASALKIHQNKKLLAGSYKGKSLSGILEAGRLK